MAQDKRRDIYMLKALAIFCVVCAHSTPVGDTARLSSVIASKFLDYMGTMGVPIFFVVSGYLFRQNKRSFGDFWKRKLGTVILPWIFCQSALWLYVVLRKGNISFRSWFDFIIGYHHTTYYLTVLMIFYCIFWLIQKKWILTAIILISALSIISTGWDLSLSIVNQWVGTYYLNPLNWAAFFAVGVLLCGRDLSVRPFKVKWYVPVCAVISVAYFAVCLAAGESIYYFSRYALIAHAVNIPLLFGLAQLLSRWKWSNALQKVGEYSFAIYLLHQFVSGIVVRITNMWDFFLIILLRPFVIIVVVMAGITCLNWLSVKSGERLGFLKRLVGVRI